MADQGRQSSLFPKRNRARSSDLKNTMAFADHLEEKKQKLISEENKAVNSESPIQDKKSNNTVKITSDQGSKGTALKNPNKSHKGVAGRKAEYSDPRLKKDKNAKISASTKVRVERLISIKFPNKAVGDIFDMALDNLVSTFDRDDRDALFQGYKEDMELLKPIVKAENQKLKEAGKRYIELTEEVDQQTLKDQKDAWVRGKFD